MIEKPLYPVIDVHNHLGGGKDFLKPERVKRYLNEMQEAGVRTVVNLDGGWGDRLKETLAALDEAHPGKFLTFALLNFDGIDDDGWSEREVKRLEDGFQAGAKGLKFHKLLGLHYRYKDGKLMTVDDPKLDPIWEACARHKRPVMIHSADPAAFFTALDRYNERWHELNAHPNWLFFGDKFPSRQVDPAAPLAGSGARRLSQSVHRHRRPHLRAGPAAIHRSQVLSEVPRSRHVWHRHAAESRGVPDLLPFPGDRRRVFRLCRQPSSSGLLDDLWCLFAQGSP